MNKELNRDFIPLMAFGAVFLTCLFFSPAMSADANMGEVDTARATLEKWFEARRIISQEQNDWALGKEMLNERIELVQREIDSLRGKITEAEKSITETDKNRAELVEKNDKLKKASSSLEGTAGELESNTKKLLQKLPDLLRERVKPLSQRLPDDPKETKLSLSERFQNVVGILNEVNKFDREITTASEVRALPDGTSSEVTALYVGIGQAYYVSANGSIAGIGVSSDKGWVWKPADQAAGEISRAIAILKNEQVASFVRLPIEIQ
jgi:hypothetical protein